MNEWTQHKNFVPALRETTQPRNVPPPPQPQEIILHAPPAQSVVISETDRAIAFNISTAGLAAIVGVGGLLLSAVGWNIPLFSLSALTIFFVLAALVWFGAWLFHNASGSNGLGLITVLLQYRLLRHEQRARLDRIASMMEREKQYDDA